MDIFVGDLYKDKDLELYGYTDEEEEDCLYAELNRKVEHQTFEGIETETSSTYVNNQSDTIQVDVKKVPGKLIIKSADIVKEFDGSQDTEIEIVGTEVFATKKELNEEQLARETSDNLIITALEAEVNERQTAINTEITSRINADTNLQAQIDTKVSQELKTGSTTDYKVLSDNNFNDILLTELNLLQNMRVNDEFGKVDGVKVNNTTQPIENKIVKISIDKTTVGLDNIDNTADLDKPISTSQQQEFDNIHVDLEEHISLSNTKFDTLNTNITNINNVIDGINDKIDEQITKDININTDIDNVSLIVSYKNLGAQTESQETKQLELASDTHAGLMSKSDYAQIRTNTSRIEQLEARSTRLLYTTKQNPDASEINSFVISKGYSEPFEGIAVVIDGTFHIWHYYDNDSIGWRDDGQDTVSQFTNTIAGIIKGESTNGKVYAETDGTGSVYGWDSLTSKVNDNESNIQSHISNSENPHNVTKEQLGLSNIDNTADIDKPISTAMQEALDKKVNIVAGKQLSTNDFTDSYKEQIDLNTENRHSHANKSLLDTYTQTDSDIKDAVNKKHIHNNKILLDNTTASYTIEEQIKLASLENYDDTELNNLITSVQDSIPTKTSELENDSNFLTSYAETDPTVPEWAKQPEKPTYDYSEIQNTPEITSGKLYDTTGDNTDGAITQKGTTEALNNKIDKSTLTSDLNQVYGKSKDGTQTLYDIDDNITESSIGLITSGAIYEALQDVGGKINIQWWEE